MKADLKKQASAGPVVKPKLSSSKLSPELSSVDRAIIDLELERSKINREKSLLVLNKALLLYFVFLFTSILGYVNNYIQKSLFNGLIIMGLCVLIIGIIPYIKTMQQEEKSINNMIYSLKMKNSGRAYERGEFDAQ